MMFEIVCRFCNHINRDQIPILTKKRGMDIICYNCDKSLLSFYSDDHPIALHYFGDKNND